MKILGLDLSTKAGVCVVESGKTVLYGEEVEFKKQTGWERVSSIAAAIMEVHGEYKPDLVVIEQLFIGHTSSAIILAEINTVVRYFLWQEGIEYIDVPATSLKKWLTGKGNAQKDVMMLEVYKQFGYSAKTNNVADAVALGMYGLAYKGESGFKSSQKVCS